MQPTDIAHLTTLGEPTLSPDGRTAVVTVTRPDLAEDEYRSRLWVVTLDGSAPPRVLTHGAHDTSPRYSPDGRRLAFLRTPPEGKPQLHVLAADGGDARALTDLPAGAGAPHWSPDSTRIAFTARVPEAGRYGQDEKVTPDKEPPRRITGLQYRLDGVGFLIDRRSHVFVVDVTEGDADTDADTDADIDAATTQITDGDVDDVDVTWSPDGQWLAFASARHEGREHDRNCDLFVMRPDGSDLHQVSDTSLILSQPRFTSDGRTLLSVGSDPGENRDRWIARNEGLFAVEVAGGRPRRLTAPEPHQLTDARLVVQDDRALALVQNRGAVDLVAVALDDGTVTTLCGGSRQITGIDGAGDTIVLTYADAATPGDLGVLRDGALVSLTDFGARIRAAASTRPIIELDASAPDGHPVHGFLVTPSGAGPHPVLLMIHGGPYTQYGWTLFDEAQVYAGAGYAVVYGNPRGSSGYGQAHGDWIRGDVGERSAIDLFALLDHALGRDDLDADRLGVLGGSHGGFMTSWLVGHSDRFRAAVSERAVNAIDSFAGSSDIGWGFGDDLYGPDPEAQHRQSPLTYADNIHTPLLIIHSEQDWRCPIEQGQRLYVALRSRDAEVELLVFPGEGHELSRSGRPQHRVARFEAILEWFGRYLG